MSIHKRIRERRAELGLSLQGLGVKVGVSWQTVQQWENEKGTMPLRKRRERLCEALGVTAEWLETGKQDPTVVPAPDGTILVPVTSNEELQLELYRGLTPEQQRELLEGMRQISEANRVTQKLIGKKLKTIGNQRVEETYGMPESSEATKK